MFYRLTSGGFTATLKTVESEQLVGVDPCDTLSSCKAEGEGKQALQRAAPSQDEENCPPRCGGQISGGMECEEQC
jgi:hypothetical protein